MIGGGPIKALSRRKTLIMVPRIVLTEQFLMLFWRGMDFHGAGILTGLFSGRGNLVVLLKTYTHTGTLLTPQKENHQNTSLNGVLIIIHGIHLLNLLMIYLFLCSYLQ